MIKNNFILYIYMYKNFPSNAWKELLADVDISPNPNPFNFWTAEYEYIKN